MIVSFVFRERYSVSGGWGSFVSRDFASSGQKQLFTGRVASEVSHVESDLLLLAYNG